jgi:hypothetical protein
MGVVSKIVNKERQKGERQGKERGAGFYFMRAG